MWQGAGVAFALVSFAVAWSWGRLHASMPLGPWPAIAASLAMPFALGGAPMLVRIVVSVFAVTTATKAWMAARSGPRDPAMATSLVRFGLWYVMPPETTWPRDVEVAALVHSRGLRRGMRGFVKVPGVAALYLVHVELPALHEIAVIEAFWALWLCWLGVSAIVDLVTCTYMLAGIDVEEIFDTPPLARSPRDFWGKRWNLFVHRFAMRFLFLPLGGRRHPIPATFGVFACSGAMHEYFMIACMGGVHRYAGTMMLFFVLQGLGVIAEMMVRKRMKERLPRGLAIGLHIGWLTATGPLFFAPLGEIFAGW